MPRIHVYEIPDDCDMTLRDGTKALCEKSGCKIEARRSMSLSHWKELNKDSDLITESILKAYDIIHEKHGKNKPPNNILGVIECPKCNGHLHYSISSYNGHIHGQCETKDCLCWMQ